jgi:hypothetical protein
MTMHLMGHAYSTLNTRKKKRKITKAKLARWETELREYNKLMKRCGSPKLTLEQYIDKVHGKVETKREFVPMERKESLFQRQSREHREKYPSHDTMSGSTPKKEPQRYTGTLVKGIATMHKSNAVPVIDSKQATEISKMGK